MKESNPNGRLEGFSDGVFAIAITLLIIDIKLPATVNFDNVFGFWLALKHITPSILAFLLSFIIIFITWVNHHACLKLLHKSSNSFVYANGFMLLTVVFIPFPTSLLGEYILTDYAAPAVILYNATLAMQAISWILFTTAAIKNKLPRDEVATQVFRENHKFGYFAFGLYTLCALFAIWFPLQVAVFTTATWVFWFLWGKRENQN
ncbi:MAG TPA: TMEM175 family protein [Bacteroidia bacterium]|nr:TMEM175 family protein [Bacteroidia bacterium]